MVKTLYGTDLRYQQETMDYLTIQVKYLSCYMAVPLPYIGFAWTMALWDYDYLHLFLDLHFEGNKSLAVCCCASVEQDNRHK